MRYSPSYYLGYYAAQIRVSIAEMLQYRAAISIWMIWLVIEPVIYLSVWTAVANSSGGEVGGFTTSDFAAYYITLLIVTHLTQIWHMWEYDYIIRQGILSGRLLLPIHPIHNDASENIGYKALMLVVSVPAALLLSVIFQPSFNAPLWSVIAFFPAVVLAGVLAFLIGWVVAMAAFWTTRIIAINQTYFVAMFFFSGQLAPMALLPDFIQTLSYLLPFRWWIAFPIELMLGLHTTDSALIGFGAQIVWIILGVVLVRIAWRAGVKQYVAMGG